MHDWVSFIVLLWGITNRCETQLMTTKMQVFAADCAFVNSLSWGFPMMMWLLLFQCPYRLHFCWGLILTSVCFGAVEWDCCCLRLPPQCACLLCWFRFAVVEQVSRVHTICFISAAAIAGTAAGSACPCFAIPSWSSISPTAGWWSSGCPALSFHSFRSGTPSNFCTAVRSRLIFIEATLVIGIFLGPALSVLVLSGESQSWSCDVSWLRQN